MNNTMESNVHINKVSIENKEAPTAKEVNEKIKLLEQKLNTNVIDYRVEDSWNYIAKYMWVEFNIPLFNQTELIQILEITEKIISEHKKQNPDLNNWNEFSAELWSRWKKNIFSNGELYLSNKKISEIFKLEDEDLWLTNAFISEYGRYLNQIIKKSIN